VPADDNQRVELKVALEPTAPETPAVAVPLTRPAPTGGEAAAPDSTWLAAPVAMGMLGVGLAAVITVRLASGVNDCVEPDEQGRCVARRTVRPAPTIGGY